MTAKELFLVFWKTKESNVYFGFVQAESKDNARIIALSHLQDGCTVTAVYKAFYDMITPQSITLNFTNNTDYHLF